MPDVVLFLAAWLKAQLVLIYEAYIIGSQG